MHQNIHISFGDNTSRSHRFAGTMMVSLMLPETLAHVSHHSTLAINI